MTNSPGKFEQNSIIRHAHFIGVCGAGMKPIAHALLSQGVRVSGSDLDLDKGADLLAAGAKLYRGHASDNLQNPDVVVYSTAISDDNPEIARARAEGIPIVHRSEMLGWFLAKKESVLIAGTHGKTTTTTLVSLLLERAGMDPWSFVGGHVREFNGNLRVGGSGLAVAEADESDGSFLNLPRNHAIITNIEAEHLNYWGDERRMFQGFAEFAHGIPKSGNLVVCIDDPGVRRFLSMIDRHVTTYSTQDDTAEFTAHGIKLTGTGSSFDLLRRGKNLGRASIGVPGLQNVANALAAFAMADQLGADISTLLPALAEFRGVDRRFTKTQSEDGYLVIDDYAHHPTEITATVAAARMLATERDGRLVAVFQPHRYSRTQSFFADFGGSFHQVDHLILTEVYASGEPALEGISGSSLQRQISSEIAAPVEFIADFPAIKKRVQNVIKDNDIVLLLGAGSVTKLANLLICSC
ncbi:UDP-N-acetylmuramate--L-alanine ligase [soil metagenome]